MAIHIHLKRSALRRQVRDTEFSVEFSYLKPSDIGPARIARGKKNVVAENEKDAMVRAQHELDRIYEEVTLWRAVRLA